MSELEGSVNAVDGQVAADGLSAKPRMVNKGFNIRIDQYNDLLMLVAYRKVRNIHPATASEILRVALDEYFDDLEDQSFRQIGQQ
jgi:hypothetical protein